MASKIHGKDERGNDGKLKDKALTAKLKTEAKKFGLGDDWEPELIKIPKR